MSLCKLVENIDRYKFECVVVSMLDDGALADRIKKAGVPVHSLGMSRSNGFFVPIHKLVKLIRKLNPDLIQTWMYHADLFGGVSGWLCRVPVVWNIRHSNMDPRVNRNRTVWIAKVSALLSRVIPSKIICCAYRALEVHAGIGYDKSKMLVIPNGFDTVAFNRSEEAANSFRMEEGIPGDAPLVGMVARFDPQKGFEDFFKAASVVLEKKIDVHFVLCGLDVDKDNGELATMINGPVRERAMLLGRRSDIPKILSALDIFVLPSIAGEAFPNVVGEAMACEVPCVVTDVGDAARIVGDTGVVVRPGDYKAMAGCILQLLEMPAPDRADLGRRARQRIIDNYELKRTTGKYEELYESLTTR